MPRADAPVLSVVVPAFRVEPYLADCLASILRQREVALEVIVVDDASPDHSGAIAASFAASDPRVRVVRHRRNRGLGAARNSGLRAAGGTYVTFPDSDDLIPEGAYAAVTRSLDESGSDFVTGPAEEFGKGRRRYWTTRGTDFSTPAQRTSLRERPGLITDHTAWTKVFRRGFLLDNALWWPEGVFCEDLVPSARAYCAASSIDVVDTPVYFYRRRPGSITTALGAEKTLADWISQTTAAMRCLRERGPAAAAQVYADKVLSVELPSRRPALRDGHPRLRDAAAALTAELEAAAAPTRRGPAPTPEQALRSLSAAGNVGSTLAAAFDEPDTVPFPEVLDGLEEVAALGTLSADTLRRVGNRLVLRRAIDDHDVLTPELAARAVDVGRRLEAFRLAVPLTKEQIAGEVIRRGTGADLLTALAPLRAHSVGSLSMRWWRLRLEGEQAPTAAHYLRVSAEAKDGDMLVRVPLGAVRADPVGGRWHARLRAGAMPWPGSWSLVIEYEDAWGPRRQRLPVSIQGSRGLRGLGRWGRFRLADAGPTARIEILDPWPRRLRARLRRTLS